MSIIQLQVTMQQPKTETKYKKQANINSTHILLTQIIEH